MLAELPACHEREIRREMHLGGAFARATYRPITKVCRGSPRILEAMEMPLIGHLHGCLRSLTNQKMTVQ